MVRLRALNKSYGEGDSALHVLKNIELDIHAGESVAIMGSSGSGKSTLLNVLGLLDRYDSGTYHLDENLTGGLSERESAALRSRTLGFVFQSFNLLPFKDAVENVALPLYYQGVGRSERKARAIDALKQMGLADRLDHRPGQLSGGQKQRVAIARALVGNPRLILADEPTGALDSETSRDIMAVLEAVNARGITLVVVTHEPDIAERCNRTIRLVDGRVG